MFFALWRTCVYAPRHVCTQCNSRAVVWHQGTPRVSSNQDKKKVGRFSVEECHGFAPMGEGNIRYLSFSWFVYEAASWYGSYCWQESGSEDYVGSLPHLFYLTLFSIRASWAKVSPYTEHDQRITSLRMKLQLQKQSHHTLFYTCRDFKIILLFAAFLSLLRWRIVN